MTDKPKHYQTFWKRRLSQDEIKQGYVLLNVDPYRLAEIYGLGGGAREQVFKKSLRWTTKGGGERQVIKEIMQACERRLEILDEDEIE